MQVTRRRFLQASTSALVGLLASPTLGVRSARAAAAEPVLVAVLLRGGADFLNLVVPYRDPDYERARPEIGFRSGELLDLDGYFGFHPQLRPLLSHFDQGRLAIVHACGIPHPSKSHYHAELFLESALPGNEYASTGWLGRYANAAGLPEPWSTITRGAQPAQSLMSATSTLAVPSLREFALRGGAAAARREAIGRIVPGAPALYRNSGANTLRALDVFASVSGTPRANYPETALARALVDVSALIRARIGVRVAAVEMTGWDTHVAQNAKLNAQARDLALALSAFVSDLGSELDRTTILVMTEFGRRVKENGSGGTEHGRAAAMLALGGRVRGGRVLLRDGKWPGLAPANLDGGHDLRVTTDFRDVFAEVLYRHMGLSGLASVFPDYGVSTSRFLGVIG